MFFIVLLMAAFSAIGCGDDSSVDPGQGTSFRPFAVGDTWILQNTVFESDGTVKRTDYDTLTINGTKVIDGETWYTTNVELMYAIRNNGIWNWVDLPGYSPQHYALYPAAINDAFSERIIRIADTSGTWIDSVRLDALVTSTNSTVTTPAGTYSCVQYKSRYRYNDGRPFPGEDYFDGNKVIYIAPKAFLVKFESFEKSLTGTIYLRTRSELISATLR